jgi:hypothetical protein
MGNAAPALAARVVYVGWRCRSCSSSHACSAALKGGGGGRR